MTAREIETRSTPLAELVEIVRAGGGTVDHDQDIGFGRVT
jgi:hypothetical protein